MIRTDFTYPPAPRSGCAELFPPHVASPLFSLNTRFRAMYIISSAGRRRERARDQDGGRGRWCGRLLVVGRGRVSGEHRRFVPPPVSRLPGMLPLLLLCCCGKERKGLPPFLFLSQRFGVRWVHAPKLLGIFKRHACCWIWGCRFVSSRGVRNHLSFLRENAACFA